jgi:hypothetical protein
MGSDGSLMVKKEKFFFETKEESSAKAILVGLTIYVLISDWMS